MTLTPRRLIAAAALLHVVVVASLFLAGRMQIAPRVVDRHGIVAAFAVDSLAYQHQAEQLIGAPTAQRVPLHVRALSILFAMFGDSTLAAEPFNLACYLAIVGLVFAIGREVGGDRVGLVAGATIALWPTFLFHTTQFLKDPIFIAGALAVVFVVVAWLTRTNDWRRAILTAVVLIAATSMLMLTRPRLAITARLIFAHAPQRTVFKAIPSATRGEAKSASGGGVRVPALVAWRPPAHGALDRASVSLGMLRNRYNLADGAGSQIDDEVEIRNARDLFAYLPRAAAIGLWAPFPSMWLRAGQSVGTAGRILSGVETAAIYLCELLAITGIVLAPRRLAPLLLLVIAIVGVTSIALVVSNIGTLYRFRYSFWALIIVAGVSGWEIVRQRMRRTAILLALLLASCSQRAPAPLTIENFAGVPIDAIYLAPHAAPTWEENLLGRTALADGEAIAVRFGPAANRVRWDLRLDGAGDRAEWQDLDLAQVSVITMRFVEEHALADCERRSD